MINGARDRPVEMNSIDRKCTRRSRLPDRPKSVLDGTFQECLLTTAHICRISLFDEWKLCSLSEPELNAHVGRAPRATPSRARCVYYRDWEQSSRRRSRVNYVSN